MIIIGGVGVPLAMLPKWCRHLAAFLPGKYAVQAITIEMGYGPMKELSKTFWMNYLALSLIGLAALIAGIKLFRWENERQVRWTDWAWVAVAVIVWVVVGVIAEVKGYI
jgi:ABC-type multidrug transport system permease subunit